MKASDLRASLLSEAVSGRLVPQFADEGTAAELLKEIEAEKKALAAAGKIKKEKPLPEITDEEIPFEIPESWEWVRLGNICSFIGDGIHGTPVFDKNGDYYFINGNNLKQGKIRITPETKSVNESEYLRYKVDLNENTFLYSINGTIGNFAYYNFEKIILGKSAAYFNLLGKISREYLIAIMKSTVVTVYSNENKSQTTIGNLSLKALRNMPVPLPPLAEQRRIVAKLDELMPLVDAYEKEEQQLSALEKAFPENLRKSILQEAVSGKLVPQIAEEGTAAELLREIEAEKKALVAAGKIKKEKPLPEITEEEIPFEIPESWEWTKINYIANVTKLAGFEYTEYIAPNVKSFASGVPLIKGKNVQNGELIEDFESYISESISDTLIRSKLTRKCLLTPYVGTIGNIAIFSGEYEAHLGSNVGKIELYNTVDMHILEEYVLIYLRSNTGLSELKKHKKATAQESISIEAIRDVNICLPPLAEQRRIVAKVEELMKLVDKL